MNNESLVQIADITTLKCLKLSCDAILTIEFIKKIATNCNKLESIEIKGFRVENLPRIQEAFDTFFENRKDTLKMFTFMPSNCYCCLFEENSNILRNITLCQNLEELSLYSDDYVLVQLSKISKESKIKRLMFHNGEHFERFQILKNLFEKARFPLLERLCVSISKRIGEDLDQMKIFTDESFDSFLKSSPHLKSIHLIGPMIENDVWNISNELVFNLINQSNIYVNFGKVEIGYESNIGLVLSDKLGWYNRQLSMEQYLLDHDISVFDKYQKMKADFYFWLEEGSHWDAFDFR